MFDNFVVSIDNILTFINTPTGELWFQWGVGIILLYPVLLIIINEIAHRFNINNVEFLHIIIHVRNIVLPVFLLYLLLEKILLLPDSNMALKIIKTTFWILLIHFILKTVNSILFSDTFKFQERIPKLLIDFIRAFLVLFGIALVAADVWGADLGKLLAALGMGSLVLGLALQDVLGGLFSGIALLSARPFSVGDWIRIGEVEGQVKNVDWRAVSLKTRDNNIVMIPNAVIAKGEFKNFNRPTPKHRVHIQVKFSLESPPNQVIQTLFTIIENIPEALKEPKPDIYLSSYDTFKALVYYEIYYFIENYEYNDSYKKVMAQVWYASKRNSLRLHPEQADYPLITTDDILAKLKNLNVFDISNDDFYQLAQNAKLESYGIKECVLRKNSISTWFYIIADGVAEQHNDASEYDKPVITYSLTAGDFFGFSGMIDENHGESVVAITDLTVIAIKIETIRKMLHRNPQIADCLESVVKARSGFEV
ncbi:mechanosensitive ion channel family protein [Candidatus Halobeggiatoa sp. HSG11]|nr:mechanosensitive ion channel family protein [Candidatus Halobeggiatoa sp. HSG11]